MRFKLLSLYDYFSASRPLIYRRKERIIRPEDESGFIFYIKQGFVRQYIISKDGLELTICIYNPGCFFPLNLTLKKGEGKYYFESFTPVEIYRLPKENFSRLMEENPGLLKEVNLQINNSLSFVTLKLESRVFDEAYKQVILMLVQLSRQFGEKKSKKVVIRYWFTHQDIATMIGLSREKVSIEINNIIKKKLIYYDSHFIVIKNIDVLSNELET